MASNYSPNKRGLYASIVFFFFFVCYISLFARRPLDSSLPLYTQDLSSDDSLPASTSTNLEDPEPISPISQFHSPDARLSSRDNTNGELNVEEQRKSDSDDEAGGGTPPDTENEKETIPDSDAENEKDPVAGNEPTAEMGIDESVNKCDLYMGTWIKDEEYPLYQPGSCPFIDEAYDCQSNGRPDAEYMKWRWKPDGCDLPRFNATEFLMRLRGKRLMLVGDSMNRNQYESLLCMLRESLHNKSRMYETHGYKISKGRGYFAFKFEDYDCTVEFVRSHYLVKEGVRINGQGNSNPTLSIDRIDKSSGRWKQADILVFNTGHWWTHGKTSRGKDYYKEGDYVHPKFDPVEAYRRALKTWAQWIDQNMDPKNKLVIYRGYSSAHFRGGEWDSGGSCNGETEPVLSGAILNNYPVKMKIVEEVIQEMKFPVILLNVTRLTNFRKDGHPSVYGKINVVGKKISTRRQDCSHWCLPGVPDAWNELIYVSLLQQTTHSLSSNHA